MSAPAPASPLHPRRVTWVVEVGAAPAHAFAPYEKHVNHSKCEYALKKIVFRWCQTHSTGTVPKMLQIILFSNT